jgi:hypothetical protein
MVRYPITDVDLEESFRAAPDIEGGVMVPVSTAEPACYELE